MSSEHTLPESDRRLVFDLDGMPTEHVLLLDGAFGDAIAQGKRQYDPLAQMLHDGLSVLANEQPAEARALLYNIGRKPDFKKHLGAAMCLGLGLHGSGTPEALQEVEKVSIYDHQRMPIPCILLLDDAVSLVVRQGEAGDMSVIQLLEDFYSSFNELSNRDHNRAFDVVHAAASGSRENKSMAVLALDGLIRAGHAASDDYIVRSSVDILLRIFSDEENDCDLTGEANEVMYNLAKWSDFRPDLRDLLYEAHEADQSGLSEMPPR